MSVYVITEKSAVSTLTHLEKRQEVVGCYGKLVMMIAGITERSIHTDESLRLRRHG